MSGRTVFEPRSLPWLPWPQARGYSVFLVTEGLETSLCVHCKRLTLP